MDLLSELKDEWNNVHGLKDIALVIVERQMELAQQIASEELSYNNAFLSESEDSYKSTDARIRARAKSLVGTNKTKYEYEFEALNNLFNLVNARISQLSGVQNQAE